MEPYLYKILSYQHWQASQSRQSLVLSADDHNFIHLSTKEQLEKIIAKYWADASRVVILKLKTERLQGELVFEANPGGTTKYYHLYKGLIPFNAIEEAKIFFKKELDESDCLPIVELGDTVLRKAARELTKEEILSSEIQELIVKMQVTMRFASGVGLAAPQIGKPLQIAVIEDMQHSHLTHEQLLERERSKVPLHVIINPKITLDTSEMAEFFEGCLSVPTCVAIVPRAKAVRVECLNERAEPVIIEAKGWYARILQHEIDHLNATLYIDRACLPSLMTQENYNKLWKDKSVQETLNALK